MLKIRMIKYCRIITIPSLCGLLALTFNANAEMYKWVDEEGNTHYTQSPPPDGLEYEKKGPPPPVSSEKTVEDYRKVLEPEKESDTAQQGGEVQPMTEAEKAEHKKKCDNVRLRLQSLQRPRISTVDESGNRVRMSEEERIKGIKEAEKTLSEHCK